MCPTHLESSSSDTTLQRPGICQHLDQDFLSSDLINGYVSIYSYRIPYYQFYFCIKSQRTGEPISLTQATEKRLRLTRTYFMIGFSNCLAHLHCRMQDKQYVWLQLERIPNLLSEADGFSYTTSMQILHTLSWLAWKAKAFSMSCSNVAMHICHRRDVIDYCSPHNSLFLVKQKCLWKGSVTAKTRYTY